MELDGLRVNHQGLDQVADDLMNIVNRIDARMNHLDAELVPAAVALGRGGPAGLHRREGEVGRCDQRDA